MPRGSLNSALTSVVLTALTDARPEQVWDALTTTGTPLAFFHDLIVETDWRPGSALSMRVAGVGRSELAAIGTIYGDVLTADKPHRLSYTLGDSPADPSVYVTWQLWWRENSTIVRLFVDEPGPYAGTPDELELIWLRIMTALIKHLDGPASRSTTGTEREQPSSAPRSSPSETPPTFPHPKKRTST